jgi:hypothetical protein
MPPFMPLRALGFESEIIYSFVIIICSLMIYFGTKELYKLSSYKGIKYFRQAFLFFAVAYFFRSFIKFILGYFNVRQISDFAPGFFGGGLSLFLFVYFSSMAIFSLLYSIMWKKWNGNSKKIYMFHTLAFTISIISILLRNSIVYLGINLSILIFSIIILYVSYKNSPKNRKHNLYTTYILLLIFWMLNIIDILIPTFLQNTQLFIYLISSGIFLLILYKVLKRVGS